MVLISPFKRVAAHIKNGTLVCEISRRLCKKRRRSLNAPVGDSYYGEQASEYLKKRKTQDYWHLEQDVMQEILSTLPDGLSVLDVPFGTGRFVKDYLDKDFQIQGLDSSRDMIVAAEKELGADMQLCDIRIGDALALPYDADSVDLVVTFRFLSHIVSYSNAKLALKEFARVSRSMVLAQFRVRNDDAPVSPLPAGDEPMGDLCPRSEIEEILAEVGLKVAREWSLETRETYSRSVFLCHKKTM